MKQNYDKRTLKVYAAVFARMSNYKFGEQVDNEIEKQHYYDTLNDKNSKLTEKKKKILQLLTKNRDESLLQRFHKRIELETDIIVGTSKHLTNKLSGVKRFDKNVKKLLSSDSHLSKTKIEDGWMTADEIEVSPCPYPKGKNSRLRYLENNPFIDIIESTTINYKPRKGERINDKITFYRIKRKLQYLNALSYMFNQLIKIDGYYFENSDYYRDLIPDDVEGLDYHIDAVNLFVNYKRLAGTFPKDSKQYDLFFEHLNEIKQIVKESDDYKNIHNTINDDDGYKYGRLYHLPEQMCMALLKKNIKFKFP